MPAAEIETVSEPMGRVRWKFTMDKHGWRGVVIEGAGEPHTLTTAQAMAETLNQIFGEGSHWCETIEGPGHGG